MKKKKFRTGGYSYYLEKQRLDDTIAHLPKDLATTDNAEEIIVHWVNKYGVHMDIKTRKGGLIHSLWLAEDAKRRKKQIEKEGAIDIQTEVTIPSKRLEDEAHPSGQMTAQQHERQRNESKEDS